MFCRVRQSGGTRGEFCRLLLHLVLSLVRLDLAIYELILSLIDSY